MRKSIMFFLIPMLAITWAASQTFGATMQAPGDIKFAVHPNPIITAKAVRIAKPYVSQPPQKQGAGHIQQRKSTVKSSVLHTPLSAGIHIGVSGCAAGSTQPAPIVALVSALKCDPDLIFEYVYNNIEYEPLYGSNKGALGTLLDRRGDDADQAILLVTLWNVAGYSQTGYFNEGLIFTGTQISNWLGVPNDAIEIQNLLFDGGVPYQNVVTNPDGTLQSITVNHFVAALQLGGTWYYFDPSYKVHNLSNGIASLSTALGYNRSQFLANAGGTIGSYSIASVNRGDIRADLGTYAENLINYINQNNRTWTVGDVIGGKTIQPLTGSPIRIQHSGWTPSTLFPVDCPNQTPSNIECRTYISVTMPGASSGQAIKMYTDEIYGHRVTVFSTPNGSSYTATLLIDGAVPGCVGGGTCVNTGTSSPPWLLHTDVVQTNQPESSLCASGVTDCRDLSVAPGGSYLISVGVGQVSRGMAEYHRQLLAQARATGNPDTSEVVLGENLAVISYNWLAELSNEQQVADRLVNATTLYNFGVGITAQSNIQASGYQGPYVDLPMNDIYIQPWYSTVPTTVVGNYSYPTPVVSGGMTVSQALSTLESGVLLQTQAPLTNPTAASTIMLVDANMNSSYPGNLGTTYFADGTTTAGKNYFNSTIVSAITSHYGATDLSNIETAVNNGAQVLIPENGSIAVGHWSGAGYTEVTASSASSFNVAQLITGGMSGGFFGTDDPYPAPITQVTLPFTADTNVLNGLLDPIPALDNPQYLEPVDGVTGAYIYKHDDLVTGGNGFPYALPFSRTYLSSSGTNLTTTAADIGMGNGWANTYSAKAQAESDPYVGMGSVDSSAISAATSIAALYVIQDLLSVTPSAQTMTVSSMATEWFSDQLINNTLVVNQPNTSEEFVALPHADGATSLSFNPPLGSSARLSQTATGQYTYKAKNGVALNFGPTPAGALQSWTFPNGVTVNLTYTGSNLTGVSNNLGRSLTLSYTGNDITSVEDDTSRSVSYEYDANHNLIQFTDPMSQVTKFAYDTSGTYDTAGHLTQVFYPSNPAKPYVTNTYDPMGRVAFQANANGDVSDFYMAGSRTELVDALGNRHVTYQTDHGQVILDAWVLSGSADVFNDTVQDNGVVNVTTSQYDGLDRLVSTTAPEGDSTSYAYDDTGANPWANNIETVTKTPKPGSPLSPIVTSFTYDPLWNEVATVTDPLSHVTQSIYDSATGNLLQTILDAGVPASHSNVTTTYTYNSVGQVLTMIDPLGVETAYTYDSYGNQKTITRDAGTGHLNQLTQLGYTALGDVNSVTDPNDNVTTSLYDADRRVTSTTYPLVPPATDPLVTSYTYDPDSHLIQTQQSQGSTVLTTTSSTYTLTGKVLMATDARGNVSHFYYDADDRLSSTADRVGKVTSYVYDAMSRQTQVLNTAIQATPLLEKAYQPDGPIASLTDANSNTTTFDYDGLNRLATTTYPGGGSTETYTYDADSNVLSTVTRKGDTISFAYDALNRRCTKAIATSPTACTATSSSNPTVWYSYDAMGHVIGTSDNGSSIVAVSGSPASYETDITYDPLNHPSTVSWNPAPTQATPASESVTDTLDYDRNDRRIGDEATDNSWWSYPAPTASSVSYTANALNQYTAVGSTTPTYDSNGNLTYDGSYTYCYDAQRHLTGIVTGTCTSPTTTIATYAYDAQGRRKEKTVSGTSTVYVTDADNREVLEYNGSTGAIQAWYAYGIGSNEVLNRMNVTSSTRQTLIPDNHGSIAATLDSSTGTTTKIGYQTYGEHPSLSSGSFNYTAQRFDPETSGSASQPSGLYYYRARMYSPSLGRFLQVDPIGYDGGMNLYAYVNDDPLNRTDPSGKCIEDLCIVEGAAVVEAVETAPVWVPIVVAGAKAAAGFVIGYGGAELSGVQSQGGRITGGVIGAVTLPVGSLATGFAAEALGYGTAGGSASLATGGTLSTLTGAASSAAGQYYDTGEITLKQTAIGGAVGLSAYVLSGSAAVDYGLGYFGTGATPLQETLLGVSTSFNEMVVGSELGWAANRPNANEALTSSNSASGAGGDNISVSGTPK